MEEVVNRNIITNTTETLLLLGCFTLITIAKTSNESRFQAFFQLFISDKYLKIYGKEQNLNFNTFNILLFTVQIIVLGFLTQSVFLSLSQPLKYHITIVITGVLLVILFKYYLEKLIAVVLDLEHFTERYNFYKLSYRNLISLCVWPLLILLIYSPVNKKIITLSMIGLFLALNFIAFLLTLKNYQKLIINNLFYFILYLCTLEIAPYLIAFKLVI